MRKGGMSKRHTSLQYANAPINVGKAIIYMNEILAVRAVHLKYFGRFLCMSAHFSNAGSNATPPIEFVKR